MTLQRARQTKRLLRMATDGDQLGSSPRDDKVDWYSTGLHVRHTLEKGDWKKEAETPILWLKDYSKSNGHSTNMLRRFGNLSEFAEKLASSGAIVHASDAGKFSPTKLEIVSKIWDISPVEAQELIGQMKHGTSPSLRDLRDQYGKLRQVTDQPLKAGRIASNISKTNIREALQTILNIPEVVTDQHCIVVPFSRAFEFVTIDGLIGTEKDRVLTIAGGIIVVRSREVINKTTTVPFLAHCCYLANFFDVVWVIGQAADIPKSRKEPNSTDSLSYPLSRVKELGIPNIGIIEIQEKGTEIIKHPLPAAKPAFINPGLIQKKLPHNLYQKVLRQV